MNPTTKGAIVLSVIGGAVTIIKLIVQSRANRELRLDNAEKETRLASSREREGRHAKEQGDRDTATTERAALIAQVQKATEDTLTILKAELAAQQKTNDRAFDLLDRNTRAVEATSLALAAQAVKLDTISAGVSGLAAGTGCRARSA